MYRASKALSVPQARDYYQKEYSRGDYYEHDTLERKGEWHGQGADRLELRGEVRREDFHALLEGKGPDGVQLVAAEASTDKHRAGWDFTCSADKSVSLMAVVEGDEGVRQAHRLAVDRSLDELERYVQTKDRFRDRQTTGEMVAAKFEHESSRALDPQLHTHVVVMNTTRRADGQWRALEPREMFAAQKLVTATYRAELSRELTRLGYAVEVRADGSVGIAGFSRGQLDHFSQRRAQIEAYLTKHGVGGAGHAERAARTTRRAKVKDIDRDSVVGAWRARAKEQGLDLAGIRARAREAAPDRYAELVRSAREEAGRSVTHAIEHVTERKAVFHGREMDAEALRHGMGRVTLGDVRQASAADRALVECPGASVPSGRFTTQDTIREERRNVGLMKAGQGDGSPVLDSSAHRFTESLSPDQERVARHILTTRDPVIGVEGKAGTGKTHLLGEVRQVAEGAGWRVRGFAPTTGAVKLLDEAGIQSATVASLRKETMATGSARELWIVDEAGMLSTRQAATVLARAQEQGARVVLLGDSRQHAAVEAGRPFDYLAREGMKVEQLGEIRRQTNEVLRQAVKDASEGRVRLAVSRLEGAERVIEVKDPLARHRALADEVARHADKRTLVVAPSNEERQQINRLVRERLIADGRVEKASLKVDIATGKGLTAPELKVARNYEPGDHVRFNRGARTLGLDAGAEGRVVSADPRKNHVTVQLEGGSRIEYDPRTVSGASVAKVEERRLAVGDRVQFRAPDRAQHIPNGQLGTLRELDGVSRRATVELDSGRRVTLDLRRPQALDYGYASTSHAAQGQTVDRVLVTIDTERSAALVNQKQFYVSISRAREDAVIYTDSRKDLVRAVSREADKPSALDYVNRGEERRHGNGPEPRREHGARVARRVERDEPAAAQKPERGDGRAAASPRAAAPADRRGEDAGRAAGGAEASRVAPRASGEGDPRRERGAGTRDHGGHGEPGAALGGHRSPVSDARGRAGQEPERGRTGPVVHAPEGGRGWDDRGRGARVGADAVPGHAESARGREPHPLERGGAEGRTRTGLEGRAAEDSALSPLARLRIRDEEHRALQGLLPPDLARAAGKLNAAARELGVARIVTPERVKQLGEATIRGVVSLVDPKKAAMAIGRALVTRLVQGAERER